jgi:hypothetical protein
MRTLRSLPKIATLVVAAAATAAGVATLAGAPALADPQPECGPTYQWICIFPPCLACPPVEFDGTICEKQAYEKKTGRVCTRQ